VKRLGWVAKIKPDRYEEYKCLHAEVWPDVLRRITACNLRNYSIYHKDGTLFSYVEYVGEDLEADMAKMAADPATQKWWDLVVPMFEDAGDGGVWSDMEEVFHLD